MQYSRFRIGNNVPKKVCKTLGNRLKHSMLVKRA